MEAGNATNEMWTSPGHLDDAPTSGLPGHTGSEGGATSQRVVGRWSGLHVPMIAMIDEALLSSLIDPNEERRATAALSLAWRASLAGEEQLAEVPEALDAPAAFLKRILTQVQSSFEPHLADRWDHWVDGCTEAQQRRAVDALLRVILSRDAVFKTLDFSGLEEETLAVHRRLLEQNDRSGDSLSKQAGRPGPIERLCARSQRLILGLHAIVGLRVVALLHACDSALEMVSEYIARVYGLWLMLRARGKKWQRAARGTLHSELAQDVYRLRAQLSQWLALAGYASESHLGQRPNDELEQALARETFHNGWRGHELLEEMRKAPHVLRPGLVLAWEQWLAKEIKKLRKKHASLATYEAPWCELVTAEERRLRKQLLKDCSHLGSRS